MHAVSVPPLAGAAGGDTATNERLRMLGMTRRFPHPLRMSLPLPSVVLVVVHALQRDPQPRGNFFLDANDRFRLRQLSLEPSRLAFQFRDARIPDILRRCLRSTLHRSGSGQRSGGALPPPGTQTRRVQSFPPQQGSHLAHIPASVGFTHDSALILATESTPCRLLRDLRVWTIPSPTGRPARNSSRPTGSFRSARRFVLCFSDHQHRLSSFPPCSLMNG